MTVSNPTVRVGAALAGLLVAVSPLVAQVRFGALAIPTASRMDPAPGGEARRELRIAVPVAFASLETWRGRLAGHAMLNLEGLTLRSGQLAAGVWGEGFVDRRHPHTYGHEIVAWLTDAVRLPVRWSLAAGRGFAPFGSDDPMNRPALLYPVNHHWAQIPERAVAVLGLAREPVVVEGGLFNGDEPSRPTQWPNWSRFADSWSARLLLHPSRQVEFQTSYARVKSPENRAGAGLEHRQSSTSLRVFRPLRDGSWYFLVEQARTREGGFFIYNSTLGEVEVASGRSRLYLRLEQTDRPEEVRDPDDPFRSQRPHFENSNLGITRWQTVTAGYGFRLLPTRAAVRAEAIAEGTRAHVRNLTGLFDPADFYGGNDLWMFSVAVRIAAGEPLHRMGRYGVLAGEAHRMQMP